MLFSSLPLFCKLANFGKLFLNQNESMFAKHHLDDIHSVYYTVYYTEREREREREREHINKMLSSLK